MNISYPQLHDGSNSSKKHLQIAEGPIQLLRFFCWSTHLHLPKLPSESESRIHTRRATRFWSRQFWKKTTRFQRFFCSPGTLRKLDPFFDVRAYFGQRVFVKNRQRKRENNHGRLILVASYPSTAQSSDFVNAVPTGPFRPAKEKTPENLEETQTPLFRKNGVFFPPN